MATKRLKTLSELTATELQHCMVVQGRGVHATLDALDIVKCPFILILHQDHQTPQYCSNVGPDENIMAMRNVMIRLRSEQPAVPVVIAVRETMKQSWLRNAREMYVGVKEWSTADLRGAIYTFARGWGECIAQYQGLRAFAQWRRDYPELNEPGWIPDETWRFDNGKGDDTLNAAKP